MKKNKVVNKDSNENQVFFQKYREDKKFNAKVQLLGYGVLVLLVVLFLNINNMNSLGHNNISEVKDNSFEEENTNIEKVSLLESINNNYEYDINVDVIKSDSSTYNYRYYGKSYDNNIILNKTFDNTNNIYYGKDGYYYIKNEVNEYGIIELMVLGCKLCETPTKIKHIEIPYHGISKRRLYKALETLKKIEKTAK